MICQTLPCCDQDPLLASNPPSIIKSLVNGKAVVVVVVEVVVIGVVVVDAGPKTNNNKKFNLQYERQCAITTPEISVSF